MHVVILGVGNIGAYLAQTLSREGHSVVVIDRDPKALERIERAAEVGIRLGSGTDWNLLKEILSYFTPDCFLAMTSDDETNLVACSIAKHLGFRKTIARIRQSIFLDQEDINFHRLFSVDHILGTEQIVADDIFNCIRHPGDLAVEHFADGDILMRTILIPESFQEKDNFLVQVDLSDDVLVGLIKRKMENELYTIIFPKEQDVLLAGDEATFIGKTAAMNQLYKVFGLSKKTVRCATLMGGSGIAVHLAFQLNENNIKVKIIEQDEQRCQELSHLLPFATILNQDGTNLNLLREERSCLADVFVTCTRSHETNVLAAIVAKQAGFEEVVALVADGNIAPLLHSFHISYALSEEMSIARRVQVILHNDTFVSFASLYDHGAKVMEVKISKDSCLAGVSIDNLSSILPSDFIIAMIGNASAMSVPKKDYVIESGNTAIIVCGKENIQELKKFL